MACPNRCQINMHLLPVKGSYYFTLAAVASLLPYLAVYMKHLGLSPSETAIIYGAMPFLGALVRPIFGALADKFHKHKEILMVVCILTGAFHAGLLGVPGVPPTLHISTNIQLSCSKESHIKHCGAIQHQNKDCQLTNDDFLNKSSGWDIFDPFLNISSCSLQCKWQEDLCLGKTGEAKFCTDRLLQSQTTNSSQFKVLLKSMERMRSVRSGDDDVKPSMCNFYSLSNFIYNESDFHNLHCPNPTEIDCVLTCDKPVNYDLDTKCFRVESHQTRYSTTFWGFFVLMFLANIAFAPIFSLIDAMTYDFLGEERGKWGRQRLWGTIAFALHGLATGFMMDLYSDSGKEFLIAFVSFAVFEIVTAIVVCQYRISSKVACQSMMSNIRSLLTRVDILALFVIIFIFGMFTGVIETFLFWYLTGLGATKTLFGLCMFFNCFPEIFIFFLSGIIMKHIGQVRCLYIVCFAYALRFAGYSLLINPWIVLVIEPLHSITYGLMYASASSYGSIITPTGMHGTVQGLIGGLHFGFGKGCGSVLGGLLYEAFGAIVLFRGCAVASVVTFVLYFSVQQYLGCSGKANSLDKKKEMTDIGAVDEKGEMLPQPVDTPNSAAEAALKKDGLLKEEQGDSNC